MKQVLVSQLTGFKVGRWPKLGRSIFSPGNLELRLRARCLCGGRSGSSDRNYRVIICCYGGGGLEALVIQSRQEKTCKLNLTRRVPTEDLRESNSWEPEQVCSSAHFIQQLTLVSGVSLSTVLIWNTGNTSIKYCEVSCVQL